MNEFFLASARSVRIVSMVFAGGLVGCSNLLQNFYLMREKKWLTVIACFAFLQRFFGLCVGGEVEHKANMY